MIISHWETQLHVGARNCQIILPGFLVGWLVGCQMVLAQDWTQWGGPHRDFSTADEVFHRNTDFSRVKEKWRVPIGSGNSGICVRDHVAFTAYTRDGKEYVAAFSTRDGRQIWKREFDIQTRDFMDLEFGLGPHSTPLVTESLLFCIGLTGRLSALDVQTGNTVWEKELWASGEHSELERGCAASPVAFADSIIVPVGGQGQSVRCFAMQDGAIRWQQHDYTCAYASPLIAELGGRSQAILLMDQSLIGLDPVTGQLLWDHPVPTERYVNCTSPLVGPDDTIFINTGEGLRGLKLNFESSQFQVREMWASRITICQTTNFILRDGVLYGAKEGSVFAAVDATSGRTLWQSRELKDCCIIASGRHLIAVQENGQLVIAKTSPAGIQIHWRHAMLTGRCWVGPVVAGKRLLVRDNNSLIAFELP